MGDAYMHSKLEHTHKHTHKAWVRNVYDCYIKDLTNIKYVMGLSSAFSITKTSAKYYKIKLQAIRFYISVGSNTFISNVITVIITYCCKDLIYRFANKFSKIFDPL